MDTRALLIALYAFNAGIRNARAEYEAHPSAACGASDRTGGKDIPCDDLAADGDTACPRHRRIYNERNAADRARYHARKAQS